MNNWSVLWSTVWPVLACLALWIGGVMFVRFLVERYKRAGL